MKNIFLIAVILLFVSCKNDKKVLVNYSKEKLNVTTSIYPENITKVFDAHGGLDRWNSMQSLEYTMLKGNNKDITITNLKNRKTVIHMPKYDLGFNGKDVWLKNKDTVAYKGKPRFMYNLMFYFYAMPFILADDGIIYENAEPLLVDNKSYPGIKISYDSGVGESPEDEYILYYDSETYKMTWLGYTVTYFSKEKSKVFHYRKYTEWETVNGLLLPKTMERYKSKDNLPKELHSINRFENIKLSSLAPNGKLFEIPEGAKIIE